MEKPSHELSVGEILSKTFNLYISHFPQFFIPFLVSGIILAFVTYTITTSFPLPPQPSPTAPYDILLEWIISFFSTATIIGILSGIASWIIGTTTTGIVIKYASFKIEKNQTSLGASLSFTISLLPWLLIAQLIAGILIGIGLIVFVIPGIIFAIMFSLIMPAIIIEGKGVFESLGRSRKLVNHRWFKTFGLMLILGIITIIIAGVGSVVAIPLHFSFPFADPLITNIITAFVSPIYPIAITYFYYAMAAREIPPPPPPQTI